MITRVKQEKEPEPVEPRVYTDDLEFLNEHKPEQIAKMDFFFKNEGR